MINPVVTKLCHVGAIRATRDKANFPIKCSMYEHLIGKLAMSLVVLIEPTWQSFVTTGFIIKYACISN
jgi:hypothetical protein